MKPSLWDREMDGSGIIIIGPGDTTGTRAGRRKFTVLIFAYLLALVGLFAFFKDVFGWTDTMGVGLVAGFPLLVAIRLHERWSSVRRGEMVLLAVLTLASTGGATFVVANLYATGMDHQHAQDRDFQRLMGEIRHDPAFQGVDFEAERKGVYWLDGVVTTRADLERLDATIKRSCLPVVTDRIIVIESQGLISPDQTLIQPHP